LPQKQLKLSLKLNYQENVAMDIKKLKEKISGFYNSKGKLVLIGGSALVLVIAAAAYFTSRPSGTERAEPTVQYIKVTTGS